MRLRFEFAGFFDWQAIVFGKVDDKVERSWIKIS